MNWHAEPAGSCSLTVFGMRKANHREKTRLARALKSDLAKVDAHSIRPHEYKELPALTQGALSRAVVKKGGRTRSANPRKLISIRLLADVVERWKATARVGKRAWPSA